MQRGPRDTTWERSLGMFASWDLTGATVLGNAWRRARPRWVRFYAMHAMLRYLDPYRLLDLNSDSAGEGASRVGMLSHSMLSDGPMPLPDSAASMVARVLVGVALRTRGARIGEVANGLGGIARGDAIRGGAPDTVAQALLAALPPSGITCTDVMITPVVGRRSSRWDVARS
jgi:hypothetical protein